jgi:hypothetical protein
MNELTEILKEIFDKEEVKVESVPAAIFATAILIKEVRNLSKRLRKIEDNTRRPVRTGPG